MKTSFFLSLGIIFILGSIFLFLKQETRVEKSIRSVKIGTASILVEVADTFESRKRGLSGREKLPDGTGMLFIFENPGFHGFWMKEMHFAIDIIWVNSENRVVGVEKEVSPTTFPEIFYPNEAIKYVLEVPAGFSETHGLDTGIEMYLE